MRRRALALRRAKRSSSHLASQTVQVTSDANASPIITAFTTMSALMNMPHGDRSCGSSAAPTSGRLGGAVMLGGAAALGAATAGKAGAAGAAAGTEGAAAEVASGASCCAQTAVVHIASRAGTMDTLTLRLMVIPPLRVGSVLPLAPGPAPCGWHAGAAR